MSLRHTRAALALRGALLCVALAACGACAREPVRVLLIGDSITAGIVSEPKGPAYAELLAQQLGPGFEVVNAGSGGSSTLDWQPGAQGTLCRDCPPVRLYEKRARPALPADFAVILLGTNDMRGALELAPVEPDAYRDALRALAEALHADGAREVVLVSPPFSISGIVRLAGYRPRIQALCAERPFLHCGPDLVELLDSSADFAPGDAHPNASGHAKIAAALAATLRERAEARP